MFFKEVIRALSNYNYFLRLKVQNAELMPWALIKVRNAIKIDGVCVRVLYDEHQHGFKL